MSAEETKTLPNAPTASAPVPFSVPDTLGLAPDLDEDKPEVEEPEQDEMAILEGADYSRYTLASGEELLIEPLRTRQFFKLLRILTRGSMDILGMLSLDPRKQTTEEFTMNLIAMLVFAVPEAEQETVDFLRSMVRAAPVEVPDDVPPAQVAKVAEKLQKEAEDKVTRAMVNPELDDLAGLVEAIARREAPNLMALGKRLISTWKFSQKAKGQPTEAPETEAESLEASPEPST